MPDPIGIGSSEAFGTPTACIDEIEHLLGSEKESYVCVELSYGNPRKVERYTNWNSDVNYGPGKFTSVPSLEVAVTAHTAKLNEEPSKIRLPNNLPLTAILAKGEAHSRILVHIMEVFESVQGKKHDTLFMGRVVTRVNNKNNVPGLMELLCVNIKSRLRIPLGLSADHQCQNIFGKKGCNAAFTSVTGVITAIDQLDVTVDADFSSYADSRFLRGQVQYDGLNITIRKHTPLAQVFSLTKKAPADWLGKIVTVISGCTRTEDVCDTIYGNLSQFLAPGYAMPDHNPLTERNA